MAKERTNQVKKQKTPLKSVFRNFARKLAYLLLSFSLIFVIYLIDRSKLFEPKIAWEINGELVSDAQRYEDLVKPLIQNKYLLNLNQIKEKLRENEWVSDAQAQRILLQYFEG